MGVFPPPYDPGKDIKVKRVRVKPGIRIHEAGATYVSGDEFSIDDDRFVDLADLVEVVMVGFPMRDAMVRSPREVPTNPEQAPISVDTRMPTPRLISTTGKRRGRPPKVPNA